MTNSLPELIIKVGNKSVLSFSHSKAYRVVTYDELVATSKVLNNCHMMIIEGISDSEYDNIRDFVKSFTEKDESNRVWIYTENDSDDAVNGLIDELGYEIFDTQEKLFRDIFDKTNLNITTNVKLRKALNELNAPKEADDPFSAFTFTSIEEPVSEAPVVKDETPVVESKTDNFGDFTFEEPVDKLASELADAPVVDVEIPVKVSIKADLRKPETVKEEKVEELRENRTEQLEDRTEQIAKDTTVQVDKHIEPVVSAESIKEIEQLRAKVSELERERVALVGKITTSDDTIANLHKLNKSLTEKYRAVIEEYNSIVNSEEVLEDPISLAEYDSLKDQITGLEASLKEQKEKAERKTNKLETEIEDYKLQIQELTTQISNNEAELQAKRSELVVLNEQISSGEIQSEELEASKREIEDLKSAIEDLELVIKGQTKDINKLRSKIDETVDKGEKENFGRKSSVEFSNLLIKKLNTVSEELRNLSIENNQHREYIEKLRSSDVGNNEVIAGQTAEIIQLRQQLSDVNRQIEEAVETERYEKSLLSKQLADLQQEFDFQREQLEFKEAQYSKLSAVTTLDENGVNALEEDNRTLRDINNALRLQLKAAQDETEKVRDEKARELQAKHLLEDQVQTMKASMRSLQVNMSGGVTQTASLPTINYQGRGAIISVFGCGSYGTTITAISLARRLALTSKVLYIDLDLIAPKSDAFFNLPPILKDMPGFNDRNSRTYTGMGLFFEQGMNPLIHYREKSVIHVEPMKRGCLDYLGGVYYKLDPVKIMSADFGALLNYCGNMYNNVVIDLGRIGASDLTDKVIKAISDASMKSIGVTSADIVDIRLLRMKMMDAQINLNKVAALVNMSDSSKLDPKALKFISPSLYGVMPFYPDLYGNRRETFIERRSRDKFDNFISNVVFCNN